MNRTKAADLHAMVSEMRPDAETVDVVPQPDGVMVVIAGSKRGCGASGPHSGTDVRFVMSDDGPLMRFLRGEQM